MITYKKKWFVLQDQTIKVIAKYRIVSCRSYNESPFMLTRIFSQIVSFEFNLLEIIKDGLFHN